MISSKKELRDCLMLDAANYQEVSGSKRWIHQLSSDPISDQWYIWRYIRTLRYCEYYKNHNGVLSKLILRWYMYKLRKYARITGFQIPPNTIEAGVTIWHWGYIIVNPEARIGTNCTLYAGVQVGHKTPGGRSPRIGDHVFLGSGAKIIGDITIGNNVIIGPNAVVTKDVPEDCVIVGNPAYIIKKSGIKVHEKL